MARHQPAVPCTPPPPPVIRKRHSALASHAMHNGPSTAPDLRSIFRGRVVRPPVFMLVHQRPNNPPIAHGWVTH